MSSSDSDSVEEAASNRKRVKGVTHPDTYKRNIIKYSRVKGVEYVSYSGKQVAAVKTGSDCKCKLKCFSRLNQQIKADILTYFLSLESKDIQDTFLQSLVQKREVIRRRKRAVASNERASCSNESQQNIDINVRKNNFFQYFVKIDGKQIHVCKKAFAALHGIGKKRVERLCTLLSINKPPQDMRGKGTSNVKSETFTSAIREHIKKFDIKSTHYGGVRKQYLDAKLNVKIMYELFVKENPNLKEQISYKYYLNYYKMHFGFSFGRPQVDVCSTCESLSVKLKDPHLCENSKRAVVAEMMVHKIRAKKFYTAMKQAQANKDDNTAVLSFDYMQNLPLPAIPVQEIFYLRQLWCFVFGIHDLKTNSAKFYCYHEGQGNKTPDEICSFLLDYFNNVLPAAVEHLILFSDGCVGQNKNHTVVRFLLNLTDSGRFKTVTHYFPIRGHSFLPCDRDFGCIKRRIRKIDRIYIPEEYFKEIIASSNRGRFSIKAVVTGDIISFKNWWPKKYKKNSMSEEAVISAGSTRPRNIPFKISSYKEFQYNHNVRGKVIVKDFINGLVAYTFNLATDNRSIPLLPSVEAYPKGHVPINGKKLKDISTLSKYVTGIPFYTSLLNWPTSAIEANIRIENLNEDSELSDE